MDAIREQIQKPLVVGIAAFVLGLILGLVVLGWYVWPVQWTDATPAELSDGYKADYMRMAIESFGGTGDVQTARQRFEALGDDAQKALEAVASNPGTTNPQTVIAFSAALQGGAAPVVQPTPAQPGVTTPLPQPGAAETTVAAEKTQEEGGGLARTLLTVLCVITLLAAAVLLAIYFLRGRGAGPSLTPRRQPVTPAQQAREAARQTQRTDYTAAGGVAPISQFMASYKLGDDLFDDSFSIDSPAGEFMGECGVGISETIGVGEPKKVTAFEVWLFDKNDIQTVTKVLMSAHAFDEEATRQRLSAKGEPVLVEPGTEVMLETQTLQMVARVQNMTYGNGALPGQSFFDQFILELSIWPKA